MKNVQLIITHIDLPEDLKNALTQPEIARLQYEAGLATAELDKVKLKKAGEGHAYARKKLIEAIGENITIQSLLTMEEMAKGTSNTLIVLPTDIVAAFENIAKKGIDIAALFEGLNLDTETIKKISSALRKKGIVN